MDTDKRDNLIIKLSECVILVDGVGLKEHTYNMVTRKLNKIIKRLKLNANCN